MGPARKKVLDGYDPKMNKEKKKHKIKEKPNSSQFIKLGMGIGSMPGPVFRHKRLEVLSAGVLAPAEVLRERAAVHPR